MASWFTMYCTRSVRQVTATDIKTALDAVDFYTVAEGFGIEDESVVEQALSALQVKAVEGELGEWFEIRYRKGKSRPLVLYRWATPERVRQELAEVEENYLAGGEENDLANRRGRNVSTIRKALAQVVEVTAVELGLVNLEGMGLVVAGQVAEYLAEAGAGLIRDTSDEWWAMRKGVPKLLRTRA